ncbi:MAG: elongation factor P [Planctomycetes bacterium]|nr:elongation factor P [Planctomycetota bacterium]
MILVTEVRKGMVLEYEGSLVTVTDHHHQKMQNRRPIVTLKLKDFKTGLVIERKFSTTESLVPAHLDKREMEYLYATDLEAVFMDTTSYEQFSVPLENVSEQLPYLRANDRADVALHEGKAVTFDLPSSVVLEVTETEPGMKGATVTNVLKPATLETGLKVKVPTFVGIGDKVKIDTRTGEYLGRAQEER